MFLLLLAVASCAPLVGPDNLEAPSPSPNQVESSPDSPAPSHPPTSTKSLSPTTPPTTPAPPASWQKDSLVFRHQSRQVRFQPIGPWTRLAPASDASFPERNLIFAFIAPNGDTLRFMFVAQNDWNMAQNEADAAPWNSCAPQVADLAASLGSAPRCFLFSLGCLVARVATIQLTQDWRVFIEYRRDLTHAGRPCRDWSHPEELDHSGRETIRNLIRRADGSYQILQ